MDGQEMQIGDCSDELFLSTRELNSLENRADETTNGTGGLMNHMGITLAKEIKASTGNQRVRGCLGRGNSVLSQAEVSKCYVSGKMRNMCISKTLRNKEGAQHAQIDESAKGYKNRKMCNMRSDPETKRGL